MTKLFLYRALHRFKRYKEIEDVMKDNKIDTAARVGLELEIKDRLRFENNCYLMSTQEGPLRSDTLLRPKDRQPFLVVFEDLKNQALRFCDDSVVKIRKIVGSNSKFRIESSDAYTIRYICWRFAGMQAGHFRRIFVTGLPVSVH